MGFIAKTLPRLKTSIGFVGATFACLLTGVFIAWLLNQPEYTGDGFWILTKKLNEISQIKTRSGLLFIALAFSFSLLCGFILNKLRITRTEDFKQKQYLNAAILFTTLTLLLHTVAMNAWPPGFPQHTTFDFNLYYQPVLHSIQGIIEGSNVIQNLKSIGESIMRLQLGLVWLIESIFYTWVKPTFESAHILPSLFGVFCTLVIALKAPLILGRMGAVLLLSSITFSPWIIAYARYSDLALIHSLLHYFLVLIAFWGFLQNKNRTSAYFLGFTLALGMYLYAANQIICFAAVPLFALTLHNKSLRKPSIHAAVFFLLLSLPAVLWYWSMGRWLPIRTPYEDNSSSYSLINAFSFERVKQIWVILTERSSDAWLATNYGVFTPVDRFLFPAAIIYSVYTIVRISFNLLRKKQREIKDLDLWLLFVSFNLLLSFLPSFMAPAAWARRMIILLSSMMILNAHLLKILILRLPKGPGIALGIFVVLLQGVTGTSLYFNSTESPETMNSETYKYLTLRIQSLPASEKPILICYPTSPSIDSANLFLFLHFTHYSVPYRYQVIQLGDKFHPWTRYVVADSERCINRLKERSYQNILFVSHSSNESSPLISLISSELKKKPILETYPNPKVPELRTW